MLIHLNKYCIKQYSNSILVPRVFSMTELARGEIANDKFDGFRVELSIMCMISTIDRFDGSKRKF